MRICLGIHFYGRASAGCGSPEWQTSLPSLRDETVYVGVSAGSTVVTPNFGGETYGGLNLPTGDDIGLGLVDFS
jgi:hypothetical protein